MAEENGGICDTHSDSILVPYINIHSIFFTQELVDGSIPKCQKGKTQKEP
jgi:hypothetical protein